MVAATSARTDLTRFLELKRAAESRLSASSQPVAAGKRADGNEKSLSFMDILKSSFKGGGSAAVSAAPVERTLVKPARETQKEFRPEELAAVAKMELARRKTGLLSVYGTGSSLQGNSSVEQENAVKKRAVGNFFDAVA